MKITTVSIALFTLSMNVALAESKAFVSSRVLSTDMANQIATTAELTCRKKGFQVAVAVVDRYGNLLTFVRDPLAGIHTITVAQDKAYTAASFQGDTLSLATRIEFLKGTPRLSLVGGGVPIRVAGFMYGAVGVSGATGEKQPGDTDHACAQAGIDTVIEALEFAD